MLEVSMIAFIDAVLNSLVVILGIGLLIFVHELGHFLVAKWKGVRVEAFSLGFYIFAKDTLRIVILTGFSPQGGSS